MTARTRIHQSVPLGVVLSYVALTAWSAACMREDRRGARSTPAAVFASIDGASRAQVNAYADGLAFDTTAPGMDSASFTTATGVSYVRAEPEIGATSVSRTNLARGRIIARIRTTGAASPLHTPIGTMYLWVDSVTAEGWRIVAAPRDIDARTLYAFRPLPYRSMGRPQIRIQPTSLMIWGPCDWVICPWSDTSSALCRRTAPTNPWICSDSTPLPKPSTDSVGTGRRR